MCTMNVTFSLSIVYYLLVVIIDNYSNLVKWLVLIVLIVVQGAAVVQLLEYWPSGTPGQWFKSKYTMLGMAFSYNCPLYHIKSSLYYCL